MNKFIILALSANFAFFNGPICMPQSTIDNTLNTSMQNSQKIIHRSDPHSCIDEIGYYSSSIRQKLNGSFKGVYDINDYNATIYAIKTIQSEFHKWNALSWEMRKKLETAHQHAIRLLSIIFKHTNDLEVKQRVFLFFDESFNSEGEHLASLLYEIPIDLLVIPKGDITWTHSTSFFLTDNLWKLLDRTNDPVIINNIIAVVYKTDSATGYIEVNNKAKKIMAKNELTDEDKIILFCVTQINSYQQYNIQMREDPHFNIQMVQIAPPVSKLYWEFDRFGPKKPGLKAEQLFTTKSSSMEDETSKNDPKLLQQPVPLLNTDLQNSVPDKKNSNVKIPFEH